MIARHRVKCNRNRWIDLSYERVASKLNDRWKVALFLFVVLLVPIVPFIILSSQLEPWAEQLVASAWLAENQLTFILVVIGLLVADILLPIPSSVVCTLAGGQLGSLAGTVICWLGLNLSALIGYFLSLKFGTPIVTRFSSEERVLETRQVVDRMGPWGLALCRAIPVLAEASVLFVGLYQMDVKKFWPPVITANFGVSVAYCVLGDIAEQQDWLAAGLAISFTLPIILIFSWRFLLSR